MISNNNSIFNRNGFAKYSDLQTNEWQSYYNKLKIEQNNFLSKESKFRSKAYIWPSDALNNWSRVWEYPYIFHHISNINNSINRLNILEFGSGLTFFPYTLTSLNADVTCVDIDPICGHDFKLANKHLKKHFNEVNFTLISDNQIPYNDNYFDIIYSISVIEHLDDYGLWLNEIKRVLKPDGIFMVTFDIDLRGDREIGIEKYYLLKNYIDKNFRNYFKEDNIHPLDLLTSVNSPYGNKEPNFYKKAVFKLKQFIKTLLGMKPLKYYHSFFLGIFAAVLVKEKDG